MTRRLAKQVTLDEKGKPRVHSRRGAVAKKGKKRKHGDCPTRQPWRGKTSRWQGLQLEANLERLAKRPPPLPNHAAKPMSEVQRRILEQQALYARSSHT